MSSFREHVLKTLLRALGPRDDVSAVWEGGSAANGTTDEYSDIDLTVVTSGSREDVFQIIETTLIGISPITHRYVETPALWPGYLMTVYFLRNAPKHFFVDVGVLSNNSDELLNEFLQIERHGNPVIHFDKMGIAKPRHGDVEALRAKQLARLDEIEQFYPVYRTDVLKALDRGQPIDAYAFYFGAMIKPLVELMGMHFRPFRFDFGLRYIHRAFPQAEQKVVERLLYVRSIEEMRDRVNAVDQLFDDYRLKIRSLLGGIPKT